MLPGSSGTDVLAIAQRLAPDIPFIFLSGIYGEEHAVEMIRLGATDYVLKKNLPLLPKAVRRALTEVQEPAPALPKRPWQTSRHVHALPSTLPAWAHGTCARRKACCCGMTAARPCSVYPPILK